MDMPSVSQCLMTAFVSTYRCRAVPEFHRIPSCRDHNLLWPTSNAAQHTDVFRECQPAKIPEICIVSEVIQ